MAAPISVAPSISKSASAILPSAKVNVPPMLAFPVTVRLSATVTSEVVCPIVIAIPEVSVAIFNAPVLFAIKEFVPSW